MTLMLAGILMALSAVAAPDGEVTTPSEDGRRFPRGGQLALQAGTFVEALFPVGTLRYSHVGRGAAFEAAFSSVVFVHAVDLGLGVSLPVDRGTALGLYGGVTAIVPQVCDECVGWSFGVSVTTFPARGAGTRLDLTHRRFGEYGFTTVTAGVVWSLR